MLFSARLPARAARIAYVGAPILLGLLLYWPGITAWFQKDDFAWLGLRDLVHGWRDLAWALFAPMSQGTIRTLSERLYFMAFSSIFGIHAFPFRCWAFLTFALTAPILSSVCARLIGSRAAGFWAAILWIANSALAAAMSWTSNYYELLCGLFFITGFWLLLRYTETGHERFYWAQCATFLLGFLVLELNVFYPALAATYALCCARRLLRKILPLFGVSAVYTAIHIAAAPLPAGGPYKNHWDASMLSTLWTYWKMALGPSRLILFRIYPSAWRSLLIAALTLGLFCFLVQKLAQRQWAAVIGPLWFLIVLAPLLALRDHITDSYLTVPVMGLAIWGAWAFVSAWQTNRRARIIASLLLTIYLTVNLPLARFISQVIHDESQRVRSVVLGTVRIARQHSNPTIFLKGVDDGLYWGAIHDRPLRLFGIAEVYVLPEEREVLRRDVRFADTAPFFASASQVRDALAENRAMVLDIAGPVARDVTAEYRAALHLTVDDRVASRVDVGDPNSAVQLGPAWYPNEGGYRWMPQKATVMLRGPREPSQKLYLSSSCPEALLKSGPLQIRVAVDGQQLPSVWIRRPSSFAFQFDLPQESFGKPSVEVAVEVDRVYHASGDTRDLGLPFGVFEIR